MEMQKPKGEVESTVPTGVKIVSVLLYIGMAISVIFAGMSLVGSAVLAFTSSSIMQMILLVLVVVGYVAMAILFFFVARGLRKAKKWAWITTLVLSILGIIYSIWMLFFYIVMFTSGGSVLGGGTVPSLSILLSITISSILLILCAAVGGYLGFNKGVRDIFS